MGYLKVVWRIWRGACVALALLGEDGTREFWGLLITGSERGELLLEELSRDILLHEIIPIVLFITTLLLDVAVRFKSHESLLSLSHNCFFFCEQR